MIEELIMKWLVGLSIGLGIAALIMGVIELLV